MESISRLNGGVFEAERTLQRALAKESNYQIHVVGLRDCFSEVDLPEWAPLTPSTCAVQAQTFLDIRAKCRKSFFIRIATWLIALDYGNIRPGQFSDGLIKLGGRSLWRRTECWIRGHCETPRRRK